MNLQTRALVAATLGRVDVGFRVGRREREVHTYVRGELAKGYQGNDRFVRVSEHQRYTHEEAYLTLVSPQFRLLSLLQHQEEVLKRREVNSLMAALWTGRVASSGIDLGPLPEYGATFEYWQNQRLPFRTGILADDKDEVGMTVRANKILMLHPTDLTLTRVPKFRPDVDDQTGQVKEKQRTRDFKDKIPELVGKHQLDIWGRVNEAGYTERSLSFDRETWEYHLPQPSYLYKVCELGDFGDTIKHLFRAGRDLAALMRESA